MAKRTKAEREAMSIAQKASWARRRKEKKEKLKAMQYAGAIPHRNALTGDPIPEWKDPDPLEVQLKDAHATIQRLRSQLNKYHAFREVVNSLKGSMTGIINIVNSTNVILEND